MTKLFFRLERPSTGSSVTIPSTNDPALDQELVNLLQNMFPGFHCNVLTYYTQEDLYEEFGQEYIHEFDEEETEDLDA
jgi:hypothetical protein